MTTTTTTRATTTSTLEETTPKRCVPLMGGPNSAFARLFPEKYRQQELMKKQRSQSIERERFISDRITTIESQINDNQKEIRKKYGRVRFRMDEEDRLKMRTKSEPYLNKIHSSSSSSFDYSRHNTDDDNPGNIVYNQKIGIRYLRPPTPPSPGPLIFREIQSTPPNEPPPLIVSQMSSISPRTPSPIIVRERPPTPPEYQPTEIITKKLPPTRTPSRRIIIKHIPSLPNKPRPVIIEKWLPYKTAKERRVLFQRTEQTRTAQHNLILKYEPAQVKIKQEIENIGCFRVDPKLYEAQYGSTLRRTDSIRKVLENIGCNADLITSTGYQTCYPSTNNSSNYNRLRTTDTTHFPDQRLDSLIGSLYPTTTNEQYYDTPRIYNDHNDRQLSSRI